MGFSSWGLYSHLHWAILAILIKEWGKIQGNPVSKPTVSAKDIIQCIIHWVRAFMLTSGYLGAINAMTIGNLGKALIPMGIVRHTCSFSTMYLVISLRV